jgi:hypothetical protein
MIYQVYSLTQEEITLISTLNVERDKVRLKVEATKDGLVVDPVKLQDARFDTFASSVVFDSKKIVPAKDGAKAVYKVTQEEANSIELVNHERSNTLMIVCDYGTAVGVDPTALQTKEFAMYADLLGGFDPKKVVEVDVKSPFENTQKEG